MSQVTIVPRPLAERFSASIRDLLPSDENYVPQLVDHIIRVARQERASDVHLQPESQRLLMQWRIDGVLHTVAGFDKELHPRIVARLKVLAGLLTYRTDLPQEGRLAAKPSSDVNAVTQDADAGEVRIATFPTLFGEKAAIRLFANAKHFLHLDDLGLPDDIRDTVRSLLHATSGVILLTGPSGSGKTTTIYACLRELVRLFGEGRSLMSLEDPVEVVVPGVTQSQVRPHVGFDLTTGLKSMLRQDPDAIMIGEIRDPATAEAAFQAALTGHLVLTTFHAGNCAEAVTRLLDMGIEPYLLRSTLQTVICQRLLRKVCDQCPTDSLSPNESRKSGDHSKSLDNPSSVSNPSSQCAACGGLGYRNRFVLAEMLDPHHPDVARGIVDRRDARQLQSIAIESGTITLQQRGQHAVDAGQTRMEEVFRVLGRRAEI